MTLINDPFLAACGCVGELLEDGSRLEIQVVPDPFEPTVRELPAFHGIDDDALGA